MTDRPLPTDRFRFRSLAATAAAALGVSLLAHAAHAEPAVPVDVGLSEDAGADAEIHPDYEVDELGPALLTVNVRSALFGTDADGSDVVFALSNGEPATFTVVDEETGEQRHAEELEGFDLGGWLRQDEAGQVYFTARTGNNAGLFHFDPQTRELTELDVDLQNQRVLYGGEMDSDGVIYFGTYPDAMVMSYDTVAGELHSYGSVTDDAAYVFSVGLVGDELWAGTGPVPHLFRLDTDTGETTEMFPPEHVMDNTDWFIGLEAREDYVFVRLSPRGSYDMAVYDRQEDRWLDEVIEGTFDTPVSEVIDNKVYYLQDDVLAGFDLETEETFSTGFEDSELWAQMADAVGTYDFQVTEGDEGPVATGMNTDGQLWTYHLDSQEGDLVEADVLESPIGAHSIGVGPDGAVYMGAYLSSGAMSRIDPQTQDVEYLDGPKQGDHIITHGDQMAVSSYPGAVVNLGSVEGDWHWGSTDEVLRLDRGAPYYQDRIFAMASIDDLLAVGSVPDYGQVGGALTLLDTETGEYEVHRDVVEGQSVVSLTHHEGLIYGGSGIHGGMDSTPADGPAELFIWDLDAGEVISSEPVSDEVMIINELTVGPDEQIWGLSDTGLVFILDPETGQITEEIETGLETTNNWGRSSALFAHEGDLYGNAGGGFFRIDSETHDVELIVESGVQQSAVDGEGQIYFAGDTDVFALSPAGEQCTETITGEHRGPVTISAGTVCIQDADLRGPVDIEAGASMQMSDSTLRGPLRAAGAEDVVLSGNDIAGALHITGSTGVVQLHDNAINGSLACSGNDTEPSGSENTIRGAAGGQCAHLAGGEEG